MPSGPSPGDRGRPSPARPSGLPDPPSVARRCLSRSSIGATSPATPAWQGIPSSSSTSRAYSAADCICNCEASRSRSLLAPDCKEFAPEGSLASSASGQGVPAREFARPHRGFQLGSLQARVGPIVEIVATSQATQLIDVDYVLVAYQEPNVGGKDLRLKLQKKSSQQFVQGGKSLGVRDLREKLSGNMHSHPVNTDPPKPKATSEVARTAKKSAAPVEATPAPEKRSTNSAVSKKKSQSKTESSVDGLLRSLGLEKYLITFQAEEVDMTALMHMTDEDLKALGIPMGPRKKILLALDSRA